MDMERYQTEAIKTLNPKVREMGALDMITNAAMGLAGEGGESVDIMKKVKYHGHELNTENITKLLLEAGDTLWYINLLCAGIRELTGRADIDFAFVMELNITKLAGRYTGQTFTVAASVDREDGRPDDYNYGRGGQEYDAMVGRIDAELERERGIYPGGPNEHLLAKSESEPSGELDETKKFGTSKVSEPELVGFDEMTEFTEEQFRSLKTNPRIGWGANAGTNPQQEIVDTPRDRLGRIQSDRNHGPDEN